MSDFKLPAPDAPAEEWGRLALSIPGCWWMPGMRDAASGWRWDGHSFVEQGARHPQAGNCIKGVNEHWPDPDDPATAGCLLALIHSRGAYMVPCSRHEGWWRAIIPAGAWPESAPTLGRACIAAAAALGRWPGGEG